MEGAEGAVEVQPKKRRTGWGCVQKGQVEARGGFVLRRQRRRTPLVGAEDE